MSLEPIQHELVLPVPPEHAFELFADRLGEWWPLAYTFSGPQFDSARIDSRHWFERTQKGDETPWGDVRVFERPRRLVLQWGIGMDRRPAPKERSSEVEVTFEKVESGTRLLLEHRDFGRHGEGADMLRENMNSKETGWPLILAEFRRGLKRAGV